MKKPNNKNTKQNTKTGKNQEEEPRLSLVVDTKDIYQEDLSIFYIHPSRLSLIKNLQDKIFDEVTIKNTNVDFLTSMNFCYILRKMKIDAPIEVIISQPLSVMQSYDAKQVEANAKLAGYEAIETEEYEYEQEETKTKTKTLRVSAVRPEKNPNQIDIELEKTTTTDKRGNTTNSKVTAKVK